MPRIARRLKYRQMYFDRELGEGGDLTYTFVRDHPGSRRRLSKPELASLRGKDALRVYRLQTMTSQAVGRAKGEGAASWFPSQACWQGSAPFDVLAMEKLTRSEWQGSVLRAV